MDFALFGQLQDVLMARKFVNFDGSDFLHNPAQRGFVRRGERDLFWFAFFGHNIRQYMMS